MGFEYESVKSLLAFQENMKVFLHIKVNFKSSHTNHSTNPADSPTNKISPRKSIATPKRFPNPERTQNPGNTA